MAARPVMPLCGPGTLVWIPALPKSPLVFQQAKVLAVDELSATVRTEEDVDKRVTQIDLLNCPPLLCNTTVEADMTSLHHIHEPAILVNLERRSLKNEPYTFMGSVLVTVNPLKVIPDPSPPGSEQVLRGPPHPYVVAETAYQQMTFQASRELITNNNTLKSGSANQSIIVAGESGAGKTEASKMILAHLVARSSKAAETMDLDKRLLMSNPILESFGNAVTLRNPNSSRFGKMLRLHFEANKDVKHFSLKGATVQSYLLERSRVTAHETGERTFHIFHQILASLDHVDLKDLGLESTKKYRYAEPGNSSPQTVAVADRDGFDKLIAAMNEMGLTPFYRLGVFEVLAGILKLGELQFADAETTEGSVATVANQDCLEAVSKLLGVEPQDCARVFCERKMTIDKTQVVSKRNARSAGFARDAAVKAIYSSLFDWIMRRINEAVSGSKSAGGSPTTALGVLDIFGFESFQVNGFEQLLINFANESLQGTFNAQIFVAEATLYQKEGLFGTDDYNTSPADNSICVELLMGDSSKKQPGLLTIIDTEGKSPDASDAKLNQRIHTTFASHPCMIRPHPKEAARTFIVRHYAGPVVYTTGSFLEKNNDRLPEDMESFLLASTKSAVRELFENPASTNTSSNKKAAGPPARTIVMKFASQIRTLIDDLEATKCSFVRCIKPNPSMFRNDADPSWFDRRYVTKQLHALNIPQTAEVLRNGFPTRLEYSALVDSYWQVLPEEALKRYKTGTRDNKAFVRALFWAFKVGPECYKLGTTRVFFKSGQLAQLDSILKTTSQTGLDPDVILRFRLFYARVKWRKVVIAALAGNMFLKSYAKCHTRYDAAVKIQRNMRRYPKRSQYRAQKKGALFAQKLWRGRKARQIASRLRAEKIAEARRLAEEARAKRDKEAAEKAFQLEKELKEAEERKQQEIDTQKRVVLEALRKQVEQRNRDEREFVRRKSSFKSSYRSSTGTKNTQASTLLRRSTRVTVVAGGDGQTDGNPVRVKSGGALVAKTLGQRRALSFAGNGVLRASADIDIEELQSLQQTQSFGSKRVSLRGDLKRNSSVAVVTDAARRRASRRVSQIPQGEPIPALLAAAASAAMVSQNKQMGRQREGKSAIEKIATAAREEFGIKIKGFALLSQSKAQPSPTSTAPAPSSNGKGGLFSRLKKRLSTTNSRAEPVWVRVYYVMDKPGRALTLYSGPEQTSIVKTVQLKATLKVLECSAFGKQNHVVELKDHVEGSTFIALESVGERKRWERDVREGVIGFRAPVMSHSGSRGNDDNDDRSYASSLDGDDERVGELYDLYSVQLRQERVAQLTLLLRKNQITQKEFDEACEIIATAPDPSSGKTGGLFLNNDAEIDDSPDDDFGAQVQCPKCSWSNNTMFGRYHCVKCGTQLPKPEAGVGETAESWRKYHDSIHLQGNEPNDSDLLKRGDGAVLGMKPLPLTAPFTKELAFEDGRVSCELIGSQKQIDPQTYEEIVLFGIDIRFRDEIDKALEIGWIVSHRLEKFQALCTELIDGNGPLVAPARKKIPPFPENLKPDDPECIKKLEIWITALFKLIPSGGKQTNLVYLDEDEDEDAPPKDSKKTAEASLDPSLQASAWRSVKDAESGDLYYFNKITGETRWENPLEQPPEPPLPKAKLLPGWEPVFDKDCGEFYYWNTKTNETTWDIPKLTKASQKRKLLDVKDLLHVQALNRFLDLKRNVQRMEEMALG